MRNFATPLSLRPTFFLAALSAAFFCLAPRCPGQSKSYPAARSVNGAILFRDYCASCHGVDGKGHGPAAASLNVRVPDLTEITLRAGGVFPRARVRNIIEGVESPVPHGSREMPVWGPIFHQIDEDRDLGNVRVDNLASYIQSLQGQPSHE